MTAAAAVAAVGLFLAAMHAFGVVRATVDALGTVNGAMATLRDETLDDARRETAIQRASLRLLSACASILFRGLLAVAVSLLPIWLFDAAGVATMGGVFGLLSRPDVLIATIGVAGIVEVARRRLWPSS